jgi:hypothetical protein
MRHLQHRIFRIVTGLDQKVQSFGGGSMSSRVR